MSWGQWQVNIYFIKKQSSQNNHFLVPHFYFRPSYRRLSHSSSSWDPWVKVGFSFSVLFDLQSGWSRIFLRFPTLNKPLLSGFRKLLKMWPRWKLTRNPFGNVLTHANKWGWYELHNLWSLKTSIQVTVVYWGLKVTQKDLSQWLLKITHKIEIDQPYHHSDGQASCSNKDLIWKSSFLQMIWIIGLGQLFVNRRVLWYTFFCKSLGIRVFYK